MSVDRHSAALFLQRFFLVDVRRRSAHVSQAQGKEEYRHWQIVFLISSWGGVSGTNVVQQGMYGINPLK